MQNLINILIEEPLYFMLISLVISFLALVKYVRKDLKQEKWEVMEKVLTNETSISSYKEEIKSSLHHKPSLYKNSLKKVLNQIDSIFGNLELVSYKALDKHILFSILYTFLFFYIVWLFGGDGKIGELQLIQSENRLVVTLYLFFVITTFYFSFKYLDTIIDFIINKIPFIDDNSLSAEGEGGVVGLVGLGLVGAVGLGLGLELRFVLVVVVGGVVVGGVGVVGGVIVGVGVGVVVSNSLNADGILLLLFFLILPFINAIFDYLSMYLSRYFAQNILKTNNKWKVFADLILDLVFGIILAFGLAYILFYTIDYANTSIINDKMLHIPIEHYKELFLTGDVFNRDILWITMMFASTLIPTFMHFILALYSFVLFILVKPHLHHLVEELSILDEDDHHHKETISKNLALHRLHSWLRIYIASGMILIVAFIVVLLMLIEKLTLV